ncbi:NUDIX hydrolase [Actinoalloteichus caeruleus]|uniref:NUDIX hydrolase n=1 Tax=Actinoalloteichus cyanogriseus TaxID=2893586 RepID=UPI0004AA183A|nr:NUDIX domain-containing protein [Actinoalloteichus caeruleus]
MTVTTLLTLALVLLVSLVVLGGWSVLVANRLNRLHVRTDAAWAAVDSALARRSVVARAVAEVCPDQALATRLRTAADRAETADRDRREDEENAVGRLLAEWDRVALSPGLRAELEEAELRVILARRVHNDAVRDTLALRRHRAVRWLRLAGGAPPPTYFEIAEPEGGMDAAGTASLRLRPAARVLLVDPDDRLLLFEGIDPVRPTAPFWYTVGGGVEDGENPRTAAARELTEETGLAVAPAALVGPVWRRYAVYSFDEQETETEEWYFLLRVADQLAPDTSGFSDLERRTVLRHRWWDLDELAASDVTVYPVRLAEMLPEVLAGEWDGRTRTVH